MVKFNKFYQKYESFSKIRENNKSRLKYLLCMCMCYMFLYKHTESEREDGFFK